MKSDRYMSHSYKIFTSFSEKYKFVIKIPCKNGEPIIPRLVCIFINLQSNLTPSHLMFNAYRKLL